jgi:hypothetical protein
MDLMGSYDELLSRSVSFAHLLEDINQHQQEKKQDQESSSSGMVKSRQLSKVDSMSSEKDEEDTTPLPTNVETKQEGTVKWRVYVMYMRAGIGVIWGTLLMVSVYAAQQSMSLYSNWWLAGWSNAESDRHRNFGNCTKPVGEETNRLRLMNETQWDTYRRQRVLTLAGKCFCMDHGVDWEWEYLSASDRGGVSRSAFLACYRVASDISECRTKTPQQVVSLTMRRLPKARVLLFIHRMFRQMIRSPISFFDNTPVGKIRAH